VADPDTIDLVIRVHGERRITVDRAEYEAAKASGDVDDFLDVYLSNLDAANTVIEPDGRSYNPHDQPNGPTPAEVPAEKLTEELVAAFKEAFRDAPPTGLDTRQIRRRLPADLVDKYGLSAKAGGMQDAVFDLGDLNLVVAHGRENNRMPTRYSWCGPGRPNPNGRTSDHGRDIP
jgi:hypothetical protein